MNVVACDGDIYLDSAGSLQCSGDFIAVSVQELAMSANTLSASDFRIIAGYFVLWFALAFGVKLIRRISNT